ncbi:hypothetical protein ARZXY2_2608 [Arthrobacter sp. ZXY-2]|nr:hypothetical protein ARZXY2_2608 [Arthrobacter sp. ZXY-2]
MVRLVLGSQVRMVHVAFPTRSPVAQRGTAEGAESSAGPHSMAAGRAQFNITVHPIRPS